MPASLPPVLSASSARALVGAPYGDSFGDGASFLLDFINDTYTVNGATVSLSSVLSCSRSTAGSYWDASGNPVSAAANTLRITHDPITGERLGLRVDGQTQRVTTNPYAPATQTQSLAANTYTCSVRGVSGDSITLSGGATGTATPGSPVTFTLASTQSVTFTVAGSPIAFQCETGSIASSIIPGTTAPVTRAGDIVSVLSPGSIFRLSECTILVEFDVPTTLSSTSVLFGICDAGKADSIWAALTSAQLTTYSNIVGGVEQASSGPQAPSGLSSGAGLGVRRSGMVVHQNGILKGHNGTITVDYTETPSALSVGFANVGSSPLTGGALFYGHIRKIAYIPQVLTKGQLVARTRVPQSVPSPVVQAMWSGMALLGTAYLSVRIASESGRARTRIVASTSPSLTSPVYSTPVVTDDYGVAKHTITGLAQGTQYYYAVEVNGTLRTEITGAFKTTRRGAYSFKVGHASCHYEGSRRPVFTKILNQGLDAFFHLGDLGYIDPLTQVDEFHANYDSNFMSPEQHLLYRSVPTDYIFDDHCYGANDGYAGSASHDGCLAAYRSRVPFPPLVETTPTGSVYRAFTMGRVLFIHTDFMSARSAVTATDDANKTQMGAAQKAWFKALLASYKSGWLIVWLNHTSWIGTASANNYSWRGYTTERAEIADSIKANGLASKLIMFTGDDHMLCYDNGTNSDYATGGGAGVAVFSAAPMDQGGFTVGTYSSGFGTQANGQYGVLSITDTGGATLSYTWNGYQDASDTPVFTFSRTVTL